MPNKLKQATQAVDVRDKERGLGEKKADLQTEKQTRCRLIVGMQSVHARTTLSQCKHQLGSFYFTRSHQIKIQCTTSLMKTGVRF